MPTEYSNAKQETYDLMASVLDGYFPHLATLEPELRIDIRMASSSKEGVPAVKHHGHECFATIEVVKPKERSCGGPDLRLTIDRAKWLGAGEETRTAVLHHEISHIEPKFEKDSDVLKLDPYGRPVVKLRPDDWCLTGFRETVRIFGGAAVERKCLDRVEEMLRQQDLPFISDRDVRGGDTAVEKVSRMERDNLGTPKAVIDETHAALILVGHKPEQATHMIERALDQGRRFGSVSEMIESIYKGRLEPAGVED